MDILKGAAIGLIAYAIIKYIVQWVFWYKDKKE